MVVARLNDQGGAFMSQLTSADMMHYGFQVIRSGNPCGRRFEGAAPGAGNSISGRVIPLRYYRIPVFFLYLTGAV
jgi:hypothetical protein